MRLILVDVPSYPCNVIRLAKKGEFSRTWLSCFALDLRLSRWRGLPGTDFVGRAYTPGSLLAVVLRLLRESEQ